MSLSGLQQAAMAIQDHPVVGLVLSVVVVVSDLTAAILGGASFKRHFHLVLSLLLLSGPALSVWVSKYSLFANKNHYLYRMFLASAWGWTLIILGSFVFLLSFSIRRSLLITLRHLLRLAVTSAVWLGLRRLLVSLEDASGSCFEPFSPTLRACVESALPGLGFRLLLREGESKLSCLQAGFEWRGCEVSQEALLMCLCSLVLVEEMVAFRQCNHSPGAPLRLLYLLCTGLLGLWIFLLLCLLAHFPQFHSQLIGGALGCLTWRVLYLGWFSLEPSWYSPGSPTRGLQVPMARNKNVLNGSSNNIL